MTAVAKANEQIGKEILGLVRKRNATYGRVRMTSAMVKVEGRWANYLTRFIYLPSEDSRDYETSLSFEKLLIIEKTLPREAFSSVLQQISSQGSFLLPEIDAQPVNVNLQRYPANPSHYQPSNDTGFNLEWPADVYLATSPTNSSNSLQLPNGPLASIDQPLFDTPQMALANVFGFQTGSVPWQGAVLFVIPNYTARISQIKLGSKRMTVNFILGKNTRDSDLLAKMYLEATDGIVQKDFEPKEGDNVVSFGVVPHLYVLYLFSKQNGEVIDYRRFAASWTNMRDVVIETSPDNVEQIISRGEDNNVEFKLVMPKNWNDFAETAVAMSNSGGGTIVLGVDDNGAIVGVEDPKIADSITDALRNSCEPSIEPKISSQTVQGKTVIIIQFSEGAKKPYILKGKGIYVRVGATDRMASRDEIISLATSQNQGVDFPFGNKIV